MKKLKQLIRDWKTRRLLRSLECHWHWAYARSVGLELLREECGPKRLVFINKAGIRKVIEFHEGESMKKIKLCLAWAYLAGIAAMILWLFWHFAGPDGVAFVICAAVSLLLLEGASLALAAIKSHD